MKRLVDEAAAEEAELRLTVDAGAADIAAGRYTTVATPGDEQHLRGEFLERRQARRFVDG